MERLNLPEDVPIESKMVSRVDPVGADPDRAAELRDPQERPEVRRGAQQAAHRHLRRAAPGPGGRGPARGDRAHDRRRRSPRYVDGATAEGYAEDWDLDTLWVNLKTLYPVGVTVEELDERSGGGLSAEFLADELSADAAEAYDAREESLGEGPDGEPVMRELERRVLLSVLDRRWREHLYEMDYLQEGIGLRGYGQRDPLVEYQREAFDMFSVMMEGIKEESVGFLFYAEVNVETDAGAGDRTSPPTQIVDVEGDEGIAAVAAAPGHRGPRVGRAAPPVVPHRRQTSGPRSPACSARRSPSRTGHPTCSTPRRPSMARVASSEPRRSPRGARAAASTTCPATRRARAAQAGSSSAVTAPRKARSSPNSFRRS